jgi:hypothetical protein
LRRDIMDIMNTFLLATSFLARRDDTKIRWYAHCDFCCYIMYKICKKDFIYHLCIRPISHKSSRTSLRWGSRS